MTTHRLLFLVGSIRADSLNARVATAAAGLVPAGVEVQFARSDLPVYDQDLDGTEPPPTVVDLRRTVEAVDGLVVVTPEYNYGLPGPLKNTLDWLSRPAYRSPLRDKPVTGLGATPGPGHTARALAHLSQFWAAVAAAPLPWPALSLASVGEILDSDSDSADDRLSEPIAARAQAQLAAFDRWIDAVTAYRDSPPRTGTPIGR